MSESKAEGGGIHLPRHPVSFEATLDTLLPDARKLVRTITASATDSFAEDGKLFPNAFTVDPTGRINVIMVDQLDDQTKPQVWAMVASLREHMPIVAFISEVWMAGCKPADMNPDGSVKVMPRDRPDRIEQARIVLWQGPRYVAFLAEIKRQPNQLSEWRVMMDSDFPVMRKGEPDRLGGAMMKGGHYPLDQS